MRNSVVPICGGRKRSPDNSPWASETAARTAPSMRASIASADTGGKTAAAALGFTAWEPIDLAAIPLPRFVYGDFYAAGYTSLTVAPPKVGKSMLALAEAVDMASGRGLLTGRSREPLRVLYYNAEDAKDDIDGRVAALLGHYGLEQKDVAGRLHPISGVDRNDFYLIASGPKGQTIVNEPLFDLIETFVREESIAVAIFDPLQDLSLAGETNEVFRVLGQRLRRLAAATGVALGLIHHTRKLQPGIAATMDDARGGGALRGTARFNRLLVPMTEDEGIRAAVADHRHFFRVGEVEGNLAPPSSERNRWFEKVSVETPNGGSVGAVARWQWPDAFEGIQLNDLAEVQRRVASGEYRESEQADDWVGHPIAEVLKLDVGTKAKAGRTAAQTAARSRVKSILQKWLREGALLPQPQYSSRHGRKVTYIAPGVPAHDLS